MQYRRLGNSGLRVSVLGLGSWLTIGTRLTRERSASLVHHAFDAGVNLFDTADVYDNGRGEEQLGRCLADLPRKDYVLASKVHFPMSDRPNDQGLSRKHIFESIDASLARLKTSYLDLYQCHRYDDRTPLHETVRAFDDLIRQGKILYWGVSMWPPEQIREAVETAQAMNAPLPVSNQPSYSLLDRTVESDVLEACREHGLGVLAYSPLAQGVLTGKYVEGRRPKGSRAVDKKRGVFMGRFLSEAVDAKMTRFEALAHKLGISCAQLALAWILRREELSSVIVGATRPKHLADNLGALQIQSLDRGVLRELDTIFPAP